MKIIGIGGKFTQSGHEWTLKGFTHEGKINPIWYAVCESNQILHGKIRVRQHEFTLAEIEECF